MASVGHFITLMGVIFFFFMFFDTHYEKKITASSTLGLPRWYNRVIYYVFKICYLNLQEKILARIPSRNVRSAISTLHDNEFEKSKLGLYFV
ncbi:MAG: hypothetical protein KDH96_08805 [Candidatus Riesia sp.]|nr:hypothetical protein [Candidatus Riesia sp.]